MEKTKYYFKDTMGINYNLYDNGYISWVIWEQNLLGSYDITKNFKWNILKANNDN